MPSGAQSCTMVWHYPAEASILYDMSDRRPIYCTKCGARIPSEGDFCESCGAPLKGGGPSGATEDVGGAIALPDPSISPAIGRALSAGWDLLYANPGDAFLVGLLYVLVAVAVNSFLPAFGSIAAVALGVGMIGWAERLRRGLPADIGTMFKIAMDRIGDGLILGLVLFAVSLVLAVPALIAYLSMVGLLVTGIIGGVMTGAGARLAPFLVIPIWLLSLVIVLAIWFLVVIGPILQSFTSLAAWAIAQGKPFSEAACWAWERIKLRFFAWWLAGLVLSLISGIGVLLCYVGLFFTVPWGCFAWAVIASDTGEGSLKPDLQESAAE
jgi:hypothetical protein